jgi:predicted PurR-regulated permease PerM
MNNETRLSPVLQLLLAGACIVIIAAGMRATANLLNLFFIAWLLALSISPLQYWMMGKHLPPGLAVLITILIVIVGGGVLVSLLAASLRDLIGDLPRYQASLSYLQEGLKSSLAARGIDPSKVIPDEIVSPRNAIALAASFLGALLQVLRSAFILLFIVIVFLVEYASMRHRQSLGEEAASVLSQFQDIADDVKKYVAITGGTGLVTAAGNLILFLSLGVQYALTWAVLSFFLNFIPGIGDLLSLIGPATVVLLDQGWQRALLVAFGVWIINFVMDKVIKPRYMKRGLDISLIAIIFSLLFWAWILGPPGMFLAVPLTLAVKRVFTRYSQATKLSGSTGPSIAAPDSPACDDAGKVNETV